MVDWRRPVVGLRGVRVGCGERGEKSGDGALSRRMAGELGPRDIGARRRTVPASGGSRVPIAVSKGGHAAITAHTVVPADLGRGDLSHC